MVELIAELTNAGNLPISVRTRFVGENDSSQRSVKQIVLQELPNDYRGARHRDTRAKHGRACYPINSSSQSLVDLSVIDQSQNLRHLLVAATEIVQHLNLRQVDVGGIATIGFGSHLRLEVSRTGRIRWQKPEAKIWRIRFVSIVGTLLKSLLVFQILIDFQFVRASLVTVESFDQKSKLSIIKCPTARTGRFVIPDNVTTVGDQAFIFCSKLTSIVFHENVNYVGLDNFYGCSSLENVNLPNSMTSIPETLFANCASLTSITIPDNVESINYRGFSDCKGLKEVVMPNKVKSIAAFAFGGCTSLTTITFKGTKEEWNSIEKDETWNIGVPATTVHCSDGNINID